MMRRTRARFIHLTKRTEEKLAERSAILYARALDRWNTPASDEVRRAKTV